MNNTKEWIKALCENRSADAIVRISEEISAEPNVESLLDAAVEEAVDANRREIVEYLLLILYFCPSKHKQGMHHVYDHIDLIMVNSDNKNGLKTFSEDYLAAIKNSDPVFLEWFANTVSGWGIPD